MAVRHVERSLVLHHLLVPQVQPHQMLMLLGYELVSPFKIYLRRPNTFAGVQKHQNSQWLNQNT